VSVCGPNSLICGTKCEPRLLCLDVPADDSGLTLNLHLALVATPKVGSLDLTKLPNSSVITWSKFIGTCTKKEPVSSITLPPSSK